MKKVEFRFKIIRIRSKLSLEAFTKHVPFKEMLFIRILSNYDT